MAEAGSLMAWTIWRAQAAPTSSRAQRAYRLASAGRKSLQLVAEWKASLCRLFWFRAIRCS